MNYYSVSITISDEGVGYSVWRMSHDESDPFVPGVSQMSRHKDRHYYSVEVEAESPAEAIRIVVENYRIEWPDLEPEGEFRGEAVAQPGSGGADSPVA